MVVDESAAKEEEEEEEEEMVEWKVWLQVENERDSFEHNPELSELVHVVVEIFF
jgi:hypothetical protein